MVKTITSISKVKNLTAIVVLLLTLAGRLVQVNAEEVIYYVNPQIEAMIETAMDLQDSVYKPGAGHVRYEQLYKTNGPIEVDNSSFISAVFVNSMGFYEEVHSVYDYLEGSRSQYLRTGRQIGDAYRGDLLIKDNRIAIYLGEIEGRPRMIYAANERDGVVIQEVIHTEFDGIVDTAHYLTWGSLKMVPLNPASQTDNARVAQSAQETVAIRMNGDWTIQDIRNFMIDAKESSGVTAESINATIDKYSPTSRLKGEGATILSAADEWGINAAYFVGQMMAETSIASAYCSGETFNEYNYGCVKEVADMDVTPAGNAYPKSVSEGLMLQLRVLRSYIDEHDLVRVEDVLNRYSPAYDNNNHDNIMETIGIIMNDIGQDFTEGASKQPGDRPDRADGDGGTNTNNQQVPDGSFMSPFEPIEEPILQYEENKDRGAENSQKGVQRKNSSWIESLLGN